MMSYLFFGIALLFLSFECIFADTKKDAFNKKLDSAFIFEVQDLVEPDKVLHAEPLFIDLIRDLGARKGEKEWNVGLGIRDNYNFDYYTFLVEYEFAVIDKLGIEVELPFSIYYPFDNGSDTPQSKINRLKIAAQFTFLVSQEYKTSLALG